MKINAKCIMIALAAVLAISDLFAAVKKPSLRKDPVAQLRSAKRKGRYSGNILPGITISKMKLGYDCKLEQQELEEIHGCSFFQKAKLFFSHFMALTGNNQIRAAHLIKAHAGIIAEKNRRAAQKQRAAAFAQMTKRGLLCDELYLVVREGKELANAREDYTKVIPLSHNASKKLFESVDAYFSKTYKVETALSRKQYGYADHEELTFQHYLFWLSKQPLPVDDTTVSDLAVVMSMFSL